MQKIELKVDGNLGTTDQTGFTIKGIMVSVQGSATTEVKSAMTTVKGNGMLTMKGGVSDEQPRTFPRTNERTFFAAATDASIALLADVETVANRLEAIQLSTAGRAAVAATAGELLGAVHQLQKSGSVDDAVAVLGQALCRRGSRLVGLSCRASRAADGGDFCWSGRREGGGCGQCCSSLGPFLWAEFVVAVQTAAEMVRQHAGRSGSDDHFLPPATWPQVGHSPSSRRPTWPGFFHRRPLRSWQSGGILWMLNDSSGTILNTALPSPPANTSGPTNQPGVPNGTANRPHWKHACLPDGDAETSSDLTRRPTNLRRRTEGPDRQHACGQSRRHVRLRQAARRGGPRQFHRAHLVTAPVQRPESPASLCQTVDVYRLSSNT